MKKLIVYFYAWLLFMLVISILMLVAYLWMGKEINWSNVLIAYGLTIPITVMVRNYVKKQKTSSN